MKLKNYHYILFFSTFLTLSNSSIAQSTSNYDSIIDVYKTNAWNLRFSEDKIANQSLQSGLALAIKNNNELDIGYFYRKLISQKGIEGNLDSAHYYFEKGLLFYKKALKQKGAKKMDDNALEAHLYSELAEAYHRKKDRSKAILNYKISDSLYHKVGDSLGEGIAKYNFGDIYYEQGNFTEAIAAYTAAEKDLSSSEYYSINALIYRALSNTYEALDDTVKALENSQLFLKESLKDLTTVDGWIIGYSNLAKLMCKYGDTLKSLIYLNKADAIIDSLDMTYFKLYTLPQRAEILLGKNKQKDAITLLEKNLYLLDKFSYNASEIFEYKYTLGKSYIKNDKDKAIVLLTELEKQAEELGLISQQSFIAKSLSNIYAQKNNPAKAYFYLNKYQELYQDVLGIEKQKLIRNIEAKYQNQKKENEILAQKNQLNQKELAIVNSDLANKKKTLYILILGGLTVFLIVFFYFIIKGIRVKKEKQLLAKELIAKEEKIRISRDLHDHIASELTLIKSKIDQKAYLSKNDEDKKELDEISDYSKQAIDELRKTIWATRSDMISLGDIENNLGKFIGRFPIKNEIISHHNNHSLQSLVALSIFRVCQEAINNAVKYSNGTSIKIEIKELETHINISIIDNGIGFDINTVNKGYGLTNMEHRMKEIGGNYAVFSDTEGTRVSIKLLKK